MKRLAFVVVAACTPDIAPGAYLCGPEQLCPDGLVCNGGVDSDPETPDNVCVVAPQAEAFACGTTDTADDTPDTGQVIAGLSCVSAPHETKGCLLDADGADWFQFDVPGNCTAVQLEARLTFPVAFEPLALQLATDGAAPQPAETPCKSSETAEDGDEARCFKLTVENGAHLALGVVHAGTATCGGACAHNRYRLTVQLSTP